MRILFFLSFVLFFVFLSSDLLAVTTPLYWQSDLPGTTCTPATSANCYAPMNRTTPGAQITRQSVVDASIWNFNVTTNSSVFLYDTNISGTAMVTLFCNSTNGKGILANIYTVSLFNRTGSSIGPSGAYTSLLTYLPADGTAATTTSKNCSYNGPGVVNRKNYPLGTVASTTILKPGNSLRLWINATVLALPGSNYTNLTWGGNTQSNLTISETIWNGTLAVNVSDPLTDQTNVAATGTSKLNATLWCTPSRSCVNISTIVYMCSDTAGAGAGCNPSAVVPLSGAVSADASNKGVGYLTSANTSANISYTITFSGATAGTNYRFMFGANSTENGINQFKNSSIIRNFTIAAAPLPQFFFNATNFVSGNQYNLGNNYGFQVNITNSNGVYGVILNRTFELGRPVGTLTNYTNYTSIMVQNYTNLTFINFTQNQLGPAGTYNFTWYANNTANSWNKTQTVGFTVAKNATTLMRLFLNNTENNNTYTVNQIANFTAWLNVSKTITLRSNYTGFIDLTGTQTIFNYTALGTLGNFFNLTAFWNGDENYTDSQKDYLFNVTVAGPTLRTAVETLSLSESPNKGISAFKTGADKLNVFDYYPELQNLFRASPETLSFAETQGQLRKVFSPFGELISFNDIVGRIANLFRVKSETANIYDSGGKIRSSYLASGDLIALSDSNIRIRNVYLLQGDALSLIDSYPRLLSLFRLSNENINFYEAQSRLLNFLRANGDIVSITDSSGQNCLFNQDKPRPDFGL